MLIQPLNLHIFITELAYINIYLKHWLRHNAFRMFIFILFVLLLFENNYINTVRINN